ncbi:MAG TPA: MFS transporter [Mycobacteriales bacterium]|nr:MFS transporter [Mycobacteriales bacterium]
MTRHRSAIPNDAGGVVGAAGGLVADTAEDTSADVAVVGGAGQVGGPAVTTVAGTAANTVAGTAVAGALSRRGLRRVLTVLCVTEVASWGVLYYAFPVLAPTIGTDTGWSAGAVTGAFSISQAIAALVGVPVGRLLDRWGPRPVMTAGSVLAGPAVVVIATARSLPWFLVGWGLAGAAMSAVLYQPAFAALTRWAGPRRVTALTGLTLVAGLASTVSAPLTAGLVGGLGWRHTYLVLAAGMVVITVPAHAVGLAGRWPHPVGGRQHAPSPADPPGPVARSRAFVLLAAAVSLAAMAVYAAVIDLVPLLTGRGMSTTAAAWALGLGGIGQVCGRMGYGRLVARTSVRVRTTAVLAGCAVSIALLAALPGPAGALIAAAMLVGATRGVFTLLMATAVTDRWGTVHYGRLSGVLSAPRLLATSAAPWIGTVLAGALGGYPAAFAVLAGIGGLAAVLALHTAPPTRPA